MSRRLWWSTAVPFLLLALMATDGPARGAASHWAREAHGAARLISADEAAGTSTRLDVALQLQLMQGWHTYWRTPGDAGMVPTIDWSGSENLAGADIAWPAPHRLPSVGGLETVGYEDGVVLPITVTSAHPGMAVRLHAEVDYASCKDVCIPYHASLDLVLPAGLAHLGPEAPLIAAARDQVPGDLTTAQLSLVDAVVGPRDGNAVLSLRLISAGPAWQAPDLFVDGMAKGAAGRPKITLTDATRSVTLQVPIRGVTADLLARSPLNVTVVDGARAAEAKITPRLAPIPPMPDRTLRLSIVGIALLGGLVLNLMPCVLPVLSLKLLALAGHAGAERRTARFGLIATAVGVVASFGLLAAVLIALRAAGATIGWGIQFQQPWFLAGVALVTTLFAANLWDWLPIALPHGLANRVGIVRGGHPVSDAFFLGAFATLLASSCSAPFVGTAIGFALARGPFEIGLIFGALGLGMAAPFLAVAAAPRLIAWLPRPGPWMRRLRGILGLALVATAIWLLAVLGVETRATAALMTGAVLALLLIILAWRHHAIAPRFVTNIAAVALASLAVVIPTLHGQGVPIVTARDAVWRPFDQAALHESVAQGHVLLVDVTAAWCLTCKVNELTVLDRDPVASKLREPDVIAMRIDWTRPDPTITAYLQGFGRYGVPLTVVYGPGAPDGIALPELLTPDAVMDAFQRAGASPTSQRALRNG